MPIQVADVELYIHNMRLRMPFKYGIATLTVVPHLIVKMELRIDNRRQLGFAADHLPLKWFTKNPDTSARHDIGEMIRVIDSARLIAKAAPPSETIFDHWRKIHDAQSAWAGGWAMPPLLAHFGTSLMERAMIDAFCRAEGITFGQAIRQNRLGVRLETIHSELEGKSPGDFLPVEPLRTIAIRHTVGMADPLTDAEIAPAERLDDGLPQSLEANIRAYSLRYFKIKLFGDLPRDLDRVCRIAEIIERETGGDYHHTVDANEQFKAVEAFRQFWTAFSSDPPLAKFLSRLMFVEQPLHRDAAMGDAVANEFARWTDRPPMIIDESDGELTTARRAIGMGYAGTSHKNCKGVIKGLANACLIESRRRAVPSRRYILSGEDLNSVGPIAVQQDLCAAASFGITHVERNGHHYYKGLTMWPPQMQQAASQSHGDLYHRTASGYPAMHIENGQVQVGSLVDAPFGVALRPDLSPYIPADQWEFESLGLPDE